MISKMSGGLLTFFPSGKRTEKPAYFHEDSYHHQNRCCHAVVSTVNYITRICESLFGIRKHIFTQYKPGIWHYLIRQSFCRSKCQIYALQETETLHTANILIIRVLQSHEITRAILFHLLIYYKLLRLYTALDYPLLWKKVMCGFWMPYLGL